MSDKEYALLPISKVHTSLVTPKLNVQYSTRPPFRRFEPPQTKELEPELVQVESRTRTSRTRKLQEWRDNNKWENENKWETLNKWQQDSNDSSDSSEDDIPKYAS